MSRKIINLCQSCKLPAIEKSRTKLSATMNLIKLECGHSYIQNISHAEYDIKSSDGHTLRPFQKDGIRFIEDSGFRCLIADEMGLGKTVQYLGALKLHPEMLPALFVVKSGLRIQLMLEIMRWTEHLAQVVDSGNQKIFPFPCTVISYDTLPRIKDAAKVLSFVKTIVIDECQHIKNEDAIRTGALRNFIKEANVKHVIAASGTPVKNRPEEFFTILNMLAPERFPSMTMFINRYMESYTDPWSGKEKIVKPRQEFFEALEDIMIRRVREEVAPELPKVNRQFFNSEIEDKNLRMSYKQVQKEFEEFYNDAVQEGKDHGQEFSTSLLGFFARMRKITGFAKVGPVRDYITEFLLSCNRKIVIFGHHKETLSALAEVLDTWVVDGGWNKTLKLSADLNADQRQDIVKRFKEDPKCRILIASTLASGEGLNLQFCSDAIMMERQWNPANEEQAEARFTRIGSEASQVNVTYMISVGTIDEWLTNLVEEKRAMFAATVDNKEMVWQDSNLVMELAQMIAKKGGNRWTY